MFYVNIELCKKAEKYIDKDTDKYWCWYKYDGWHVVDRDKQQSLFYPAVPAYTLIDVFSELSARIGEDWWLHIDKAGVHYLNDKFKEFKGFFMYDCSELADALTNMLIWVYEEGHIKK